jgi:hypothetical protein
MGWPDDPAVSLSLDFWSLSEDGTSTMQNTAHNYIAIVWPPGINPPWNTFTAGNGSVLHVQRYADELAGVDATARFLQQNNYSLIDAAMHGGYEPNGKMERIFLAINGAMPWGDQGGHYPIVLYNWLYRRRGKLPSPYLTPDTPPPPPAKVPVNLFTAWHDLMHQFSTTMPRVVKKLHAETILLRRQNR